MESDTLYYVVMSSGRFAAAYATNGAVVKDQCRALKAAGFCRRFGMREIRRSVPCLPAALRLVCRDFETGGFAPAF